MLVDAALAAVAACDAENLTFQWASQRPGPSGRWHLFGAGKAAAAMARALVRAYGVPASGLVVVKQSEAAPVELLRGSHPVPSGASEVACAALEKSLTAVPASDTIYFVLSGGASSLIAAPVAGMSMTELQQVVLRLLASGRNIQAVNRLRRRLLRAAAGGLGACCVAPTKVLVLSDVLGNDLASIASGPFVPLAGDELADSPAWWAQLSQNVGGVLAKAKAVNLGAGSMDVVEHHIVADWEHLRQEAAERLRRRCSLRMQVAEVAEVEQVARSYLQRLDGLAVDEVLVGGGEPTVVLPDKPGRGGRNLQLALWMAKLLAGHSGARFVALASDGDDGNSGCAGAVVDQSSWAAIRAAGADPEVALAAADAHAALGSIGALLFTPAGKTNLLDLHLLRRLR